jgi:hypothetical protein
VLDVGVAPLLGYFAGQSAARHRVAVRGRGREGEEAGAQRSQSGGSALVAGAHWQCYVYLFEGPVRECRAGAATDCGGEAVKWKEYKCDCIQPIQELELQKPSCPSPPLTPASSGDLRDSQGTNNGRIHEHGQAGESSLGLSMAARSTGCPTFSIVIAHGISLLPNCTHLQAYGEYQKSQGQDQGQQQSQQQGQSQGQGFGGSSGSSPMDSERTLTSYIADQASQTDIASIETVLSSFLNGNQAASHAANESGEDTGLFQKARTFVFV